MKHKNVCDWHTQFQFHLQVNTIRHLTISFLDVIGQAKRCNADLVYAPGDRFITNVFGNHCHLSRKYHQL